MLRLLADEHIDRRIVAAVRRRNPAIDFTRVQEVGLRAHADSAILAWAAERGYVMVSRDRATMKDEAAVRIVQRARMLV